MHPNMFTFRKTPGNVLLLVLLIGLIVVVSLFLFTRRQVGAAACSRDADCSGGKKCSPVNTCYKPCGLSCTTACMTRQVPCPPGNPGCAPRYWNECAAGCVSNDDCGPNEICDLKRCIPYVPNREECLRNAENEWARVEDTYDDAQMNWENARDTYALFHDKKQYSQAQQAWRSAQNAYRKAEREHDRVVKKCDPLSRLRGRKG
jgi:hypothetical protein